MNKIPKSSWLALTLAATTPWASLSAQNAGTSEDEEIFELSPFTVDASQDDGYRATSTTAGSRLNTQLKDVAASVSVLTDAFMDDLGVDDVAGALSMVAGVETDLTTDRTDINLGQGFLGGDFNNVNASEGSIRVRGLGKATNAANYMEVFGSLDRYNMERVEFLRGPNALLFGLGEPGGVVNYTSKKANLNKNINKIDIKLDNFGSRRLQTDISRILIEDKLAVRFAGVTSDQRYSVKTAEQKDQRAYLAATYKPFENTRIDAYYENVFSEGRRPNYRLPQDNVSAWLGEYNRAYADAADDGLVDLLDINGNVVGTKPLEQYLNDNLVWDSSWSQTSNGQAPDSPDLPIAERIRTDANGDPLVTLGQYRRENDVRTNAFTAFYTPENGWENPLGGMFTRYGTGTLTGGDADNASPRARLRMMRSSFGNDRRDAAYVDPQVLDEGIFPYLDYEIGALPGNNREIKNQKWGINLEQKVNEDLYLNFSYLKENYKQDQIFAPLAQSHAVSIDINKYMPGSLPNPDDFTGSNSNSLTLEQAVAQAQDIVATSSDPEIVASNQRFIDGVNNRVPNPNYLRPFFHGRNIGGYTQIQSEAYLAQANYDFDFAEKSDRLGFLGLHRMTGFASGNNNTRHSYRFTGAAQYTEDVLEGNATSPVAARWFVPVYYIGDAIKPGDTSLNITGLPSITTPNENEPLPYYGYDGRNGTRGNWEVKDDPIYWRRHVLDNSPEYTEIDGGGWGASLQSFFWNRRIVTTMGYRKDTVQNDAYIPWDNGRFIGLGNDDLIIAERIERGLLPADFSDPLVQTLFRPTHVDVEGDGSQITDFILDAPQTLSRNTVSLNTKSVVFHATPWLRLFVNQSENFSLTRPTQDGFGETNPPTSGTTEEYGFGMTLLENKLDLKMNFYDTRQKDQLAGNGIRLSQRIPAFETQVLNVLKTLDREAQHGENTPYDISDWQIITGLNPDGTLITQNADPSTAREQRVEDGELVFDNEGRPVYDYPITFSPVSNPGTTQDSVSDGWEISATYNPTKSLRIFANVSKLENRTSNVERQSIEYVQSRSTYWQQFFDAGYHTNGDNDATEYILPGDPRYDDPDFVPSYNQKVAENEQPNSTLLVAELYNKFGRELLDAVRSEGTANPGISEYNARLTANYSFKDGRFKGLYFGTNLRWESGKVFGYPLVARPIGNLPTGFPDPDINGDGLIGDDEFAIVQDDVANAFQSDPLTTGGISLGYRGKLHADKISWRVQLNVDNLFKQGGDLRVIRLRPDETPVYGINVPTTFKLTNSFEF